MLITNDIGKTDSRKRKFKPSPLLDAACEFSSKIRPTSREIATFKELFYTLALKSRPEESRELSMLLSKSIYTPRSIAIFYAMDRIDAATPMLLNSRVLSETDLKTIVLKETISYSTVIAQRKHLTPSTVNALLSVDTNDQTLLGILSDNKHLNIDPEIQKILNSAKIHHPTKLTGIENLEASETPLNFDLLETNQPTDLSGQLLDLASKGGKLGRSSAKKPGVRKRLLSETHAQMIRTSKYFNNEAFAYCIQQACALPYETTHAALEKKDTGFLATLLCALEVPKLKASKIMLLIAPDLGRKLEVFRLVSERYNDLKRDDCIAYLEKLGAYFGENEENALLPDPTLRRVREIRPSTPAVADGVIYKQHDLDAPRVANTR